MAFSSYPAGTPDWWRHRLVQKLTDRQARYDQLEDYHLGNHPLPPGDANLLKDLRRFQQMARTNYVSLINTAPVGRMKVRGFQFGEDDAVDEDAKMIWAANDMDLQSKKLHSAAAVFGDVYVLVGPKDEETGFPTMTVEDPRITIVEPDPRFPTRSLAGLRMWEDPENGVVMTVLYLPDFIYLYSTPIMNEVIFKTELTHRLMGAGIYQGMDLVGVAPNELNDVPIVHFSWQPDFTDLSFGEAEGVLHIQDRINYMILDRLKIARDQAYNQRYIAGIKPEQQKKSNNPVKGPVAPPLEKGSANLWLIDNENAVIGQFDAVDFSQILEAVRDDIADIAALSQTPAHYLMNRMVNVSGDTLTQAESGFVAKTKLRMEAMGWGWERCMKVAFKYMGDSRATEVDANIIWANPMIYKPVDAADAVSKWVAAGLPLDLAMEEYGNWTPDQIKYAAEKAAQMAQQEHQMALEQTKAMGQAKAQGAGPAASKTSAAKPAAKKSKP